MVVNGVFRIGHHLIAVNKWGGPDMIHDYLPLWGPNMSSYPRELLLSLGIAEHTLPDGDLVPNEVLPFYSGRTASATPGVEPFAKLKLSAPGTDLDITLMALGVTPMLPNYFFALDPSKGEVLLLNTERKEVLGVNSTYRAFIEFLGGATMYLHANPAPRRHPGAAEVLRLWMESVDPSAMKTSTANGTWWPSAIARFRG